MNNTRADPSLNDLNNFDMSITHQSQFPVYYEHLNGPELNDVMIAPVPLPGPTRTEKRRRKAAMPKSHRKCDHCNTDNSICKDRWRPGPGGAGSLCNAYVRITLVDEAFHCL
jgi:hypothetical protein